MLELAAVTMAMRGEYHEGCGETVHSANTARKRGNPNWGKPMGPAPDVPTAFEEQVQKLGLTAQSCASSEKLKQWCECNKDRCYILESLLKRWGIPADPNFSG